MKRLIALIVVAGASILSPAYAGDASADLAVVVNKSSKLDSVSAAELSKYFLADKTKTPDGTKVILAVLDTGRPERAAALSGIYKMSESEYSSHFVEATFTGAVAAAPKALPSPAAVKKFVSDTPGAMSFLRGSEADDSVKVLKIDGKSPGDDGYSLKIK